MEFEKGPVILTLIEEWSQFFSPCNWRTFHPIQWEWEDDMAMGAFEVTLIFMGIGVCLRWTHTKADLSDDLEQKIRDLES